jgi:TonB family protein
MTISLDSGTPGPDSGGMTSIGGRAVQVVTPPEAVKRPEPIRPPAEKAPAMTIPQRGARARGGAAAVEEAPPEARGRTPTRGAETSAGSSLAETQVRGLGFGLSTGGGAGSGSTLDVADFCCPEYVAQMVQQIRGRWKDRAEAPGVTSVRFTIQRDGRLTDVQTTKSSGFVANDLNAQRAVMQTKQLPPLPAAFPNVTLTVNLTFEYKR